MARFANYKSFMPQASMLENVSSIIWKMLQACRLSLETRPQAKKSGVQTSNGFNPLGLSPYSTQLLNGRADQQCSHAWLSQVLQAGCVGLLSNHKGFVL